jgi:hypothetical protein
LPLNIHITDGLITIKAEDGTVVSIDRVTGEIQPKSPSQSIRRTPVNPRRSLVQRSSVLRPSTPGITFVKVSPRWTVRVGDTVSAQHKKGGRKFRTEVKAIKVENGGTFVQVADPRNGGTYLLGLDRIARVRS